MCNLKFVKVRDKHNEVYMYPISRIKKLQISNNRSDRIWFDDTDYYECVDADEKKKYGEKVSIKESIISL
jgi:hypothetical protein